MTVNEMLARSRSELKYVGKLRFKTGTTSADGASDGSTLIYVPDAQETDDAWNNAEVKITSGDNNGKRREVGDFVASTGVLTVIENFSYQVLSGVTFEIGEQKAISDHQLIEWFSDAQDILINYLVDDAFPAHTSILEVGGTNGVSSTLPANLAGPPRNLKFKDSSNVVHDVTILPVGEEDRFSSDPYLGSSLNDMVAIFQNGLIYYRPDNNGTLQLPVVPKFDAVTYSGGSQLPSYLHILQIKWAVYQGWKANERLDLANAARQDFFDSVNAINAKYGYTTKHGASEE